MASIYFVTTMRQTIIGFLSLRFFDPACKRNKTYDRFTLSNYVRFMFSNYLSLRPSVASLYTIGSPPPALPGIGNRIVAYPCTH